MVAQNLPTRLADACGIQGQALRDALIAFVHHCAAVPGHVVPAGALLNIAAASVLGERGRGNRCNGKHKGKFGRPKHLIHLR